MKSRDREEYRVYPLLDRNSDYFRYLFFNWAFFNRFSFVDNWDLLLSPTVIDLREMYDQAQQLSNEHVCCLHIWMSENSWSTWIII